MNVPTNTVTLYQILTIKKYFKNSNFYNDIFYRHITIFIQTNKQI